MSDIEGAFSQFINTVAACTAITINDSIHMAECIKIAPILFSSQGKKTYLKKKKRSGRSDLGFFVSEFGKFLLGDPELWWKKVCLALPAFRKCFGSYMARIKQL